MIKESYHNGVLLKLILPYLYNLRGGTNAKGGKI